MVSISLYGTSMNLMVNIEDYELSSYNLPDLIFTFVVVYISLWACQLLFNLIMMTIGGDICGNYSSRDILARLFVDAVAMLVCSWLGYESFLALNGFSSLTEGTLYDRV